MSKRRIFELRDKGVLFLDSETTFIEQGVEIGAGSIIHGQCRLEGSTSIGKKCTIEQGTIIKNSKLGDAIKIKAYSYLEEARLEGASQVGPFSNLRPGADIRKNVKIGNFVEVKKSILYEGVKASHLSYIGDAEVGKDTNIGCGFITSNYDGAEKHKTEIGENCFVGSGTQLIAPIKIEDNCFIGGGSTINKNMPEGSFAVARSRQTTKEGMAKRFFKKKK